MIRPCVDVLQIVQAHRNIHNRRPSELRMSDVTLRAVALAAGIPEAGIDAALAQWERAEPRGTILGIPVYLDQSLPPGSLATEGVRR